jgi:outer membrane lipoprotein-sorting protein
MRLICLLLSLLLSSNLLAANDDLLVKILAETDKLYRSSSSICTIEMKIKTKHWERTLVMEMWTKGMEKTMVRISSPRKDRGVATLKRNKEMWNYFPKINKVIKVPPSMMMGSWMGSDFTNDDMVKEATYLDDHFSKLVESDNQKFYQIELIPKKETVTVWGKIVLKIRKSNLIVAEQLFYSEKGELVRTMEFLDVKEIGGKTIPTTIVLTPIKKAGKKTVVKYLKAEFDQNISDSVFGRKNLQKRR